MQHDDRLYLGHMLDVARRIRAKVDRLGRRDFDADENLQLALTHLVQTIGEAGRRVSKNCQAAHPEVPWAAIIGMRHKVVHDYLDVDLDLVWEVASLEMTGLEAVLAKLLED